MVYRLKKDKNNNVYKIEEMKNLENIATILGLNNSDFKTILDKLGVNSVDYKTNGNTQAKQPIRYQVIKEFPNSPKLGTIVDEYLLKGLSKEIINEFFKVYNNFTLKTDDGFAIHEPNTIVYFVNDQYKAFQIKAGDINKLDGKEVVLAVFKGKQCSLTFIENNKPRYSQKYVDELMESILKFNGK